MSFPCQIVIRPAQPVMSVRTRSAVKDLPRVIGAVYGQIMSYLTELGEPPCGEPFVAYYNLDMQDLDLEIGFPVNRSLPGKDAIQASEMPAGDYAACLYTGPYEKMEPAYNALQEHIHGHGRHASGAAYEFYLNSPDQVPMEQLQTRILMPLAP
jgi:effector-binding domain-containing protein